MLGLQCKCLCHDGTRVWDVVSGCACVVRLCVCENRDGWLVAWDLCGCMLICFSTVWLLRFTLFKSCNHYVVSVLVGQLSCACVRTVMAGWLAAWGRCECMLVRSSAVWLIPFTLLKPLCSVTTM